MSHRSRSTLRRRLIPIAHLASVVVFVASTLIATLVTPAPALAATPSAGSMPARGAMSDRIPGGRYAIGDSVMLGAVAELRAHGIHVDAVVSRQFHQGVRIVRSMDDAGSLPRVVIVHLGNNGYLERPDCDRLVRAAGSERQVFLVTLKVPRGWRATNNHRLRACVRSHPNAHLIGWYEEAADHPGWFAPDLYHLTSRGARAYARVIARAI